MEIGDSELIYKLKNADEDGYRQLIQEYQEKIFNTCISIKKQI